MWIKRILFDMYLGFRDAIKYFLHFIFLFLLLASTAIFFVQIFLTLLSHKEETYSVSDNGITFSGVPTSYQALDMSRTIPPLQDFYQEKGSSFFYSISLSNKYNGEMYAHIGKGRGINNKSIILYIQKNIAIEKLKADYSQLSKISVDNAKLLIQELINTKHMNPQKAKNNFYVCRIAIQEMISFFNSPFAKSDLIALVENTRLDADYQTEEEARHFQEIFSDSFLTVTWRQDNERRESEKSFLIKYILPIGLSFFLITLLSIFYFQDTMFKDLERDHYIHYLLGAGKGDLILRSLIPLFVLFAPLCVLLKKLNTFREVLVDQINMVIIGWILIAILLNMLRHVYGFKNKIRG